jgi:hypothetical protein
MTIRTSVLVACMVVVPLIAMFSHRIPSGTRAAVAAFVRDAVRPRTLPVAADAAPLVTVAPAVVEPVAESTTESTSVVPAVATTVVDSLGRLRELGAVAIDCRPLQGHSGHVASCRMPVDGAGQLERVFQATGADASSAADNLLRDVTAWQRASPARTPGTMRF